MFDLAIYYRMAGGFVGMNSTTLTRIRWAFTIACYMTFVALVHHEAPIVLLLVAMFTFIAGYAGRLIPHAVFQAQASFWDSLGMTVVTASRMLLIILPYMIFSALDGAFHMERFVVCVFALFSGVGYYVGWKFLNAQDFGVYYRGNEQQYYVSLNLPAGFSADPNPKTKLEQCAVGGSEWGELITGFGYQALYMALLVMA